MEKKMKSLDEKYEEILKSGVSIRSEMEEQFRIMQELGNKHRPK